MIGGAATSALLDGPDGIAVDSAGDLYIADGGNSRIQEVAATTGTQWGQSMTADDMYTVAGSSSGTSGSSGDGGAASSALLNYAAGVSLDPHGDLIIDDEENSEVREIPVSAGTGTDSVTTPSGYTLVDSKTSGQTTTTVYTHTVGGDTSVTLSYSTSAPRWPPWPSSAGVDTTSPVDVYDDAATQQWDQRDRLVDDHDQPGRRARLHRRRRPARDRPPRGLLRAVMSHATQDQLSGSRRHRRLAPGPAAGRLDRVKERRPPRLGCSWPRSNLALSPGTVTTTTAYDADDEPTLSHRPRRQRHPDLLRRGRQRGRDRPAGRRGR